MSRGKGASAVAKAAYISGEKIKNEYDGVTHDYRRKHEVVHKEILLPYNAPPKFKDSSVLWNAVERAETRKNSQTAKHIDAALPVELSREEQIDLVRQFCMQCLTFKGMCADFAIHDKGDGNPHVHILLTTRNVNESGFTTKNRSWNDKSVLLEWRKLWADWCNHKLYYVSGERISHKSYKEQGISKIPQKHLGAAACAIEKKGYCTDKGSHNRKIILANAETEIEKFNLELEEIQDERRGVKKAIVEARLGCSLHETFTLDMDYVSEPERFVSLLNDKNILHFIANSNNGKRVVFFAKRDRESVDNILNQLAAKKEAVVPEEHRDKLPKKHHSR